MHPKGATLSLLPLVILTVLALGFVALPGVRVPNAAQPHSALIVLGAAQYNGHPSPAFKRRLEHALKLYRAGGVQHIVVTGGRRAGDPYTEGEVGVMFLNKAGIPASALLAETRSRTTIENLRNARAYLPPNTPVTLVTDEAHAPRALALARALGLDANVSASPLGKNPSLSYLLREKIALLGYALIGIRA